MRVYCKCYLRSHFGDYLLCNPRNGTSLLLADAEDFLKPLLSGNAVSSIAVEIAKKYHVNSAEVLHDLVMFYKGLARQGLVKCDGEIDPVDDSEPSASSDNDRDGETGSSVSPIGVFFSRSNLPSELHVDLTNACTERCVHCYIPQGQDDYLPYPIIEKVLREFREQQGLTVQLSGGECMMHPEFAKICKLCRKLDLNFIVLSNLTLCDDAMISVLKETDPQLVNVSLYSMKAEEHDAVTQVPRSWKRTMTAIDACQNAGIHIRLATPLLNLNRYAYPALRKFAEERQVHVIPDCEIIPMYNRSCSNLEYACTPHEIEDVFREDKHFWSCGKDHQRNPDDRVCVIGERLFLNAKGQYYGCSGMNEFVLGDACRDSVSDVWNGDMMSWLRVLKNKDFPTCVNCEHRAFCKVCPAFNFNATGSLFEPIPAKCALAEVKHRVFGGE